MVTNWQAINYLKTCAEENFELLPSLTFQSKIHKNEGDLLILIKVKEILFFLDNFFKTTNVLLRNGACKPEKRISIKSKLKRTDA